MMKRDTQYFIDKFEAIPEEKWATLVLQDIDSRRCAMGHCMSDYLDNFPNQEISIVPGRTEDSSALCTLFALGINSAVVEVNDGISATYQQETPKERILAALRDIKSKEDEEKAVQEVKDILEIPLCPDCGKPVTICDCEEEEEDDDEDWGAGEVLNSEVLNEPSGILIS